jgi:hypothetical protein
MANIYVRKSGNDSNDGSTPALAKLTIKSAIETALTNDIIYVGSGVYRDVDITINKNITIIADYTGENTGDAGEVVWTGYQNDTDSPSVNWCLSASGGSYKVIIDGFYFTGWNCGGDNMFSFKLGSGSKIKNCNFYRMKAYAYFINNLEYLENCYFSECIVTAVTTAIILVLQSGANATLKNVIIESSGRGNSASKIIYLGGNSTINIYNSDISGIIGNTLATAIYCQDEQNKGDSFNLNVYNSIFNANGYAIYISISGGSKLVNLYNCSCWDNANSNYGVDNDYNPQNGNNIILKQRPLISKYSYASNKADVNSLPDDINGGIRPAYGNTYGNIGAIESTSDIIQKESTIKDSGDYSVKVAPCNYFKKVFQVPVTASELKTVKVKIRIDGTWGTYRPRVSLSGQGMTLSTATKNATTGSFEELTVSGTPTTTGIALLTIEAHSANTDAVFYIDTITIE